MRARTVAVLILRDARRARSSLPHPFGTRAFTRASAIESPFTVFADPGKYEWHSCEQLGPQRKYWERDGRCT
jgi:hypothetical protein